MIDYWFVYLVSALVALCFIPFMVARWAAYGWKCGIHAWEKKQRDEVLRHNPTMRR